MFGKCLAFETIYSLGLLLRPILLINGIFCTHLSYVGRNNRLRAMYKFTSPQATNSRLAFLSKPR